MHFGPRGRSPPHFHSFYIHTCQIIERRPYTELRSRKHQVKYVGALPPRPPPPLRGSMLRCGGGRARAPVVMDRSGIAWRSRGNFPRSVRGYLSLFERNLILKEPHDKGRGLSQGFSTSKKSSPVRGSRFAPCSPLPASRFLVYPISLPMDFFLPTDSVPLHARSWRAPA